MPERPKNPKNPKIKTLKTARLGRSARSTDTPPPSSRARRVVGVALAQSLKKRP